MIILPVIIALAYVLIALRVVCYQRNGSRYRWGISLVATAIVAACLVGAGEIIFYKPHVSASQVVLVLLLCFIVYRCRGNVAALLRGGRQ
ncbi:hypothetical protein D3C76_639560 [compost metagenome]